MDRLIEILVGRTNAELMAIKISYLWANKPKKGPKTTLYGDI